MLNAGSHKTVPAPSSGGASALGPSALFSNTAMLPEVATEVKAVLLVAEALLSPACNRRASVQPRALCFLQIYSAGYSVVLTLPALYPLASQVIAEPVCRGSGGSRCAAVLVAALAVLLALPRGAASLSASSQRNSDSNRSGT